MLPLHLLKVFSMALYATFRPLKPFWICCSPLILRHAAKELFICRFSSFRWLKSVTVNFTLCFWKKKKVAQNKVWTVGWMRQSLYSWFHQKQCYFVCMVGWSIVMVEKDSTQACLWSFPPKCIGDFGQTFYYISICSDSSLIFQWNCSNMATGMEERVDHLFPTLLDLFTFVGGFSPGKIHIEDCPFVSGSYWYIQLSSSFMIYKYPQLVSNTRSGRGMRCNEAPIL